MKTKLITSGETADEEIQEAAQWLRHGALVAFPTETVYGLGANGLDSEAVAAIYAAKGRPADNPVILHLAEPAEVKKYVSEIGPKAKKLLDVFCPGPITLILRSKNIVPRIVTAGLDTVGIRIPSHPIARELIRAAGVPVAAPSANLSGRPSPTNAQAVLEDLNGKVAAVLDGGESEVGLESTIVDCTGNVPVVLRPGAVTLEMLHHVIGAVRLDAAIGNEEMVPRAPGMKYRHYAPLAPMTLYEGEAHKMELAIQEAVRQALASGKCVGAIVSEETALLLPRGTVVRTYGRRGDTAAIAAQLYTALRSFDAIAVDEIFAEGMTEQKGLSLAVMNRMYKASGYRTVQLH